MRYVWIFLFSSICLSLFGQGSSTLNNNNVVGWSNIPTSLARNERVSYNDVKGNCFWNQDWLPARIYMNNGMTYYTPKAKLNFYSSELHYIAETGAELSLGSGIEKIIFYSPSDTSKAGIFKKLKDPTAHEKDVYMQVLAGGKIQLLKITKVKLVKREADPLLKTTENSFESWESYFIEEKRQYSGIKKN